MDWVKYSVKATGLPENLHPLSSRTGLDSNVIEEGKRSRWWDDINQLAFLLPEDDHRLPPFTAYVRGRGGGCCEAISGFLPRDQSSSEGQEDEDAWAMTKEEYAGTSSISEVEEPTTLPPLPAAIPLLSILQDEWFREKVKFLEGMTQVGSRDSHHDSTMQDECNPNPESLTIVGSNYSPVSTATEPESTSVVTKDSTILEQENRRIIWNSNTPASSWSEEDEDEKRTRRRERFGAPPTEMNGTETSSSPINVTLDEVIQERNISYIKRNLYWEEGQLNERGNGRIRRGQWIRLECSDQNWTASASHPDYDHFNDDEQIDFEPWDRKGWSRVTACSHEQSVPIRHHTTSFRGNGEPT